MPDNHTTPFDELADERPQRPTQALPPRLSAPRTRGGKLPVPTGELNDYGDLPPDDAWPPDDEAAPVAGSTPALSFTAPASGPLPHRMPTGVLIGLSVVAGALLVVLISLAMNALIAKPPLNSDGLVGDEPPRVAVVPADNAAAAFSPEDVAPAENAASENAAPPNVASPAEKAPPDAPQGQAQSAPSSSSAATFTHSEKGYRITPPAGFTLQKEGRRTIWQGPNDAQLLVETTPSPQGSARAGWERLDKDLARKYGARYRNLGISETTLAGRPAAVWEFEITGEDGQTTRKMDIGVHQRGTGYAVLAAAPAASFEELRPQLEQAVRSFELPAPTRSSSRSAPRRSTPQESTPSESTPDSSPPSPPDDKTEEDTGLFDGY
jgi:hypothetical protein